MKTDRQYNEQGSGRLRRETQKAIFQAPLFTSGQAVAAKGAGDVGAPLFNVTHLERVVATGQLARPAFSAVVFESQAKRAQPAQPIGQ